MHTINKIMDYTDKGILLKKSQAWKWAEGSNQGNFQDIEFIFPNKFIQKTIQVSESYMMKLTPTLMGHTTVKLRRFLQIPSTKGLGKCIDIILDLLIYHSIRFGIVWKISGQVSEVQERIGRIGKFWLGEALCNGGC